MQYENAIDRVGALTSTVSSDIAIGQLENIYGLKRRITGKLGSRSDLPARARTMRDRRDLYTVERDSPRTEIPTFLPSIGWRVSCPRP